MAKPSAIHAGDACVRLDTTVGVLVLDRNAKSKTAYVYYRGTLMAFPARYQREHPPIADLLPGLAGRVARGLLARAGFVWEVAPNYPLRVREHRDSAEIVDNPEFRRGLEALAKAVLAEIALAEFERVATERLEDPDAIFQPTGQALTIHATPQRLAAREAYLGRLAPLGGTSAAVLLEERGYVEARSILTARLPYRPVTGIEEYSFTSRYGTDSAFVKPGYRARDVVTESAALAAEIPAASGAPGTLPELELVYDLVDEDRETRLAFLAGARLVAAGRVVSGCSLEMVELTREFQSTLSEALRRDLRTRAPGARWLVFGSRAQAAAVDASEDNRIVCAVSLAFKDDPSHPLHAGHYATFPEFGGRHRFIEVDEPAYQQAIGAHLLRDGGGDEALRAVRAFAEASERDLLGQLESAVHAGASQAVRDVRDLLRETVVRIRHLSSGDFVRPASPADAVMTEPVTPQAAPDPVPIEWERLADERGEFAFLLVALRRDDAVPVPADAVAHSIWRREALPLPASWALVGPVFRFAAVGVVRLADGRHAISPQVRVVAYDNKRRVVVTGGKDVTGLAEAIAGHLGTHLGDPAVITEMLARRAEEDAHLPDRAEVLRRVGRWVPEPVESSMLILERGVAANLDEAEQDVADLAGSLKGWLRARVRVVAGERCAIGREMTRHWGQFEDETVVRIPRKILDRLDSERGIETPAWVFLLDHEPDGRAVWLRRQDGVLRLEQGIAVVKRGVLIRLETPEAVEPISSEAFEPNYSYGFRDLAVKGFIPASAPAAAGVALAGEMNAVYERPAPRVSERGDVVAPLGIREATLFEAYAEGGSFSSLAARLPEWGAERASAATVRTRLREAAERRPDLAAKILRAELLAAAQGRAPR